VTSASVRVRDRQARIEFKEFLHLQSAGGIFLVSPPIADDIGAVLIIAFFYSAAIKMAWLAVTAGLLAVVLMLRLVDVWFVPVYAVVAR
jgi:NhaA family Na+:H+ antiporter